MWSMGGGLFWCRRGGSGCRRGMVMAKDPVDQDGWRWRAVNQDRRQEQQDGPREGSRGHGLQLGHLLVTTAERVWSSA